MSPTGWAGAVEDLHRRLVRGESGAGAEFWRAAGVGLDPRGDFRFARSAEEILLSGVATGCDDYVKAFLSLWSGPARMVWMVGRSDLAAQSPGRPLRVQGREVRLGDDRPVRLLDGHQVAAVFSTRGWALVDPSYPGQFALPLEGRPGGSDDSAGLVGKAIEPDLWEEAWPVLARSMSARGRGGETFVIRRVDADPEAGNSVERNQKIYASGDPAATSSVVR